MTQKEYREKIEKYEKQIFDLQTELNEERNKNFNYLEESEIQKRLIIEQIKRFCELYKPKEGIGEGGLDELAEKILSFSKDYISKDKIKEIIENTEADIDYLTHDLIEDLYKLLEE